MSEYFVDLKDLEQDKVSLEGVFEPGAIEFAPEVRQANPLIWKATAERAGEEIRITGSLDTVLEQTCSRCLEPARCEITRPFDLYFRQRNQEMFDEDDDIELTDEDTRTAFFTGTRLALGDVLREQVLLALPMKALCRVDCKGLCPSCGMNLNVNSCNCPKERLTPNMDQLLELKRKLEERS